MKITEPSKEEIDKLSPPSSPSHISNGNGVAEDILIQNRLRLAQKMSGGPKKKEKYVKLALTNTAAYSAMYLLFFFKCLLFSIGFVGRAQNLARRVKSPEFGTWVEIQGIW